MNLCFSFEFFPYRTYISKFIIFRICYKLFFLVPSFVSITFNLLNYFNTIKTVLFVSKIGFSIFPHIPCVGISYIDIFNVIRVYINNFIYNFVIIFGEEKYLSYFDYSTDLIIFLKKYFGSKIRIGVSLYPEGYNKTDYVYSLGLLKKKKYLMSSFFITQLFYNIDSYFNIIKEFCYLVNRNNLLPGLACVSNFHGLKSIIKRFSIDFPSWFYLKMIVFRNCFIFSFEIINFLFSRLFSENIIKFHFYLFNSDIILDVLFDYIYFIV